MDRSAGPGYDIIDPEMGKCIPHEGFSRDARDSGELRIAMEVLTRVDLDLAYSLEKLVNLENLSMNVLSLENEFEAIAVEDEIPADSVEKVLAFDLLYAFLNSEVQELDKLFGTLQTLIIDADHKISSCELVKELYMMVQGKLQDSKESLRQSQERVLEFKMQLTKLKMTSLAFSPNEWRYTMPRNLSEDFPVSSIDLKPHLQTVEQRHILRMLEKSLARELETEKKLTEMKENEEDLKLKLRLTEQVATCMEEAAEVIWGRFLEAENTAEVLMGISKEMAGRVQLVHFNLNGSVQREQELRFKLQDCIQHLNAKEMEIEKLNNNISQLIVDNSEVSSLKEKVKLLEEQLSVSDIRFKEANASYETSQEQIREMENLIESLRENIYQTESRAETAEAKVTQLTETNLELTEELAFLKSSNDSNGEKVSVLEEQLRELELQLQHARASSEASHEQQNMLYSAIWDMETLIDEMKQKVSNAEIKTDNAEERCIMLSEMNMELNKELDFLKAKMECLETSSNEAAVEKIASAKDISMKTNLIMDMLVQLASERERIKKQLFTLATENNLLREKLNKTLKEASQNALDNGHVDNKDMPRSSVSDPDHSTGTDALDDVTTESISQSCQVDESPNDAPISQTEIESSNPTISGANLVMELQAEQKVVANRRSKSFTFMAMLVLLLSVAAAFLLNRHHPIFNLLDC